MPRVRFADNRNMLALQKIAKQLATIASVDDAKEIRDKAEAIRVYSRQQKHCKHIEREATVIRLRAERQLGKLLSQTVKAGNPNCHVGGQLPEGITRNQSSAWQLIAKLPVRQFEKYLECRTPTTKGAFKLAIAHNRKKEAAKGPDTGGNILTGDMWQLHSHLEDDSVDLFFTDPPYNEVDCYSRLAELAAKKLKDGRLCLAYPGQFHMPEIMQRMGEHLTYHWMFAALNRMGAKTIYAKQVHQAWHPILVFSKGKPKHNFVRDCLTGQGNEKDKHHWQKNELESVYLIEKLTEPGDLVVDPYCGSGTTLTAAKNLGRNYLGCEIDSNVARGARRRVA